MYGKKLARGFAGKSMRVTFRAIAGPMVGKEFLLRPAQLMQVGRTDWADVAFPGDGHMSSIHFAVETDLKRCYIKDLDSTNGTFLNGRQVKQCQVVADGDEVVAGDTSFKVEIEGGNLDVPEGAGTRTAATRTVAISSSNSSAGQPAGLNRRRSAKPLPYTVEKCTSGLTLCRGEVATAPAADVALGCPRNSRPT